MFILLNRKAFETALPDVATTFVKTMIAAHMTGQKPLHEGTKRFRGLRLHHQMKMIRHEAEGQKRGGEFGPCFREEVDEALVVFLVMKDLGSPVAAIDHVKEISGFLTARDSRHDRGRYQSGRFDAREK